ncbi:Predicted dehydrogenase [Colwellia chukchiensis]|uniref:Predicted dehydrogenase n=1 Tax=Colwellia chukchiensis TaxID=641665 RepID=A0A1H7QXY0_9GAMM|nr:oxidoreductase [Colwellia chukchiensis]SEL52871.1 Predicted dehydrogenase [Colwellia chukchiensis]
MAKNTDVDTIKTALVGYGFSAKTFHLPFISSLAEFEVAAISSSQQKQVKTDWPNAAHYFSAEEMLTTTDAQLVIITAPNDVHYSLAKLALENNKHVILEKPFVTNVADGEALIALAKEKSLLLSVYQNRRWDGDFLTVKKLLATNALGNIKHFESHFDRFRPKVSPRWREQAQDGGGILFDLGPHLIDQALQLFGIPKAITAQCEIMREHSTTIDYFNISLHYPDMLASLQASLFSAGPNLRFNIQGDKGHYRKFGLDPQEAKLKAGAVPIGDDWGQEMPQDYGQLYLATSSQTEKTLAGGYQHFYKKMAEAINTGAQAPVSANDALWTIRLISMAMDSSRLGKTLAVSP